jgi:hypothetical protein
VAAPLIRFVPLPRKTLNNLNLDLSFIGRFFFWKLALIRTFVETNWLTGIINNYSAKFIDSVVLLWYQGITNKRENDAFGQLFFRNSNESENFAILSLNI